MPDQKVNPGAFINLYRKFLESLAKREPVILHEDVDGDKLVLFAFSPESYGDDGGEQQGYVAISSKSMSGTIMYNDRPKVTCYSNYDQGDSSEDLIDHVVYQLYMYLDQQERGRREQEQNELNTLIAKVTGL